MKLRNLFFSSLQLTRSPRSQFQVTRDQFLPIFRLDDSPSYGPLYIRETLCLSLFSSLFHAKCSPSSLSLSLFLLETKHSISRSVENAHLHSSSSSLLTHVIQDHLQRHPRITHQEKRCVTCDHRVSASTDALQFQQQFCFFLLFLLHLFLWSQFLSRVSLNYSTDRRVQLSNGCTRTYETY